MTSPIVDQMLASLFLSMVLPPVDVAWGVNGAPGAMVGGPAPSVKEILPPWYLLRMPIASVRGVNINYQILGDHGPWVALSPGGRRDLGVVSPLAELLAAGGYRVLIHDRRNCGASDVVIEGDESEHEIWAEDLYELLSQLDALPAVIGGSSAGCRLSLLFALRHPEAVRALLLWRVTGGPFAAERLAHNYYGQFIDAATQGGMAAVCETEFFRERIASNPKNRARLLAMDAKRFIDVMAHWREYFIRDADLPVIGASADALRSITVPACVIPGNDWTHPRRVGEQASRLLPRGELHILMPQDMEVDLFIEAWEEKREEMASIFINFLNRASAASEERPRDARA
jgi:pimeloyl-ACP methyl ester carboxylesterase